MSEPEVKFEIDEHGRIGYRVTNEGVLLSKDEKEFIIDHITRMQAENARLRELVAQRTAKRVIVSNADTDHATGHCECGACGGAIDFWDAYCRHCGARMEEDA